MTDKEVEDIIRSNMNLQMNLAGIRADFEEKLQRTWVGLTDEEAQQTFAKHNCTISADLAGILARAIEAKLKEKNA